MDKREATARMGCKVAKRPVGRPRLNRQYWRSVVRLPPKMAKQLAKAAKANKVSINAAIELVLGAWLQPLPEPPVDEVTGDQAT